MVDVVENCGIIKSFVVRFVGCGVVRMVVGICVVSIIAGVVGNRVVVSNFMPKVVGNWVVEIVSCMVGVVGICVIKVVGRCVVGVSVVSCVVDVGPIDVGNLAPVDWGVVKVFKCCILEVFKN